MSSVVTASPLASLMPGDPRVLGDLVMWSQIVDVSELTANVEKRFVQDLGLPGCVVCKGDAIIGVLSRKRLFAALSRPFSRDLFVRRPIDSLVDIDAIDSKINLKLTVCDKGGYAIKVDEFEF